MAIPLALIVGLIAVLAFANTKSKRGERTLTLPDEPEPPRTLANHAPTTAAPRSRPVVVKLEVSIGLSVSSLEKLFMSTDSMEEDLVKFTTASTRRLNRATPRWTAGGRFVHPRVTYADKDYGFRITVSLEYTAAITRAEMTRFQQLVSTLIAENDQLRPRLLFVHARKV